MLKMVGHRVCSLRELGGCGLIVCSLIAEVQDWRRLIYLEKRSNARNKMVWSCTWEAQAFPESVNKQAYLRLTSTLPQCSETCCMAADTHWIGAWTHTSNNTTEMFQMKNKARRRDWFRNIFSVLSLVLKLRKKNALEEFHQECLVFPDFTEFIILVP